MKSKLGIAAALLAAVTFAAACSKEKSTGAESFRNTPVIVISIDTLRADRLPAYGYKDVKTPAIDALRRDAVLFSNAYSHCPMTLPSHVSILTGLLPHEHGVRNNLGYSYDGKAHPGVMHLLKGAGYETGAAVSAYVLRSATGLGSAFDFYDDALITRSNVGVGELSRPGDATAKALLQWIEPRKDKPFFAMLHLFEPHAPYEAAEPFRTEYAARPYDGEVATSDAIVGRFIERLKALGVYDNATIILLSDHGEGLGDHGEPEHGLFLYKEAIHVPLIVKLPRSERGNSTVDAVVQLADVAPTVVKMAGIEQPKTMAGVSLLDAASAAPRRVYSETMLPRIHFGWSDLGSAIDATHHYIRAPKPELYDLKADPAEKNNVLAEQRRVYADMRKYVESLGAEYRPPSAVSGEEAEKLAALGYIGQVRDAGGDLPDPKDRIGDLEKMRQGAALEQKNDVEGALALYRGIIAENPRFVDAWVRVAVAEEKRGKLQEAIGAYRRAIEVAPTLSSGFALSLGSLYLRVRDFQQADAHARLALDRAPGGAHILLARIALARGDAKSAVNEARLASSDATRKHDANVVLARALAAAGQTDEALRTIEATGAQLAAEGATVEDLQGTRADILARMNRFPEAEAAFREELAAFPQNRTAWTSYAFLLVTQGREADAERVLEEFVRTNPAPSSALLAAETWSIVGNDAAAARWRNRAARF